MTAAELTPVIVDQLARGAEAGRGCPLRKILDELPGYEQRLAILQQIQDANKKHRQANASLPELFIDTYTQPSAFGEVDVDFGIKTAAWMARDKKLLYHEELKINSGKHVSQCHDLGKH